MSEPTAHEDAVAMKAEIDAEIDLLQFDVGRAAYTQVMGAML